MILHVTPKVSYLIIILNPCIGVNTECPQALSGLHYKGIIALRDCISPTVAGSFHMKWSGNRHSAPCPRSFRAPVLEPQRGLWVLIPAFLTTLWSSWQISLEFIITLHSPLQSQSQLYYKHLLYCIKGFYLLTSFRSISRFKSQ